MDDYSSLDAVLKLIEDDEDPRSLGSVAMRCADLGRLARGKSVRLAERGGVCQYCFTPLNSKLRCSTSTCPGWMP
jgi:hypothetical protein